MCYYVFFYHPKYRPMIDWTIFVVNKYVQISVRIPQINYRISSIDLAIWFPQFSHLISILCHLHTYAFVRIDSTQHWEAYIGFHHTHTHSHIQFCVVSNTFRFAMINGHRILLIILNWENSQMVKWFGIYCRLPHNFRSDHWINSYFGGW